MARAKLKQNGQVTIPVRIRDELGIVEGDYLEIKAERNRIVLIPKQPEADRHPAIDAALAEGLADERAGRVSPPFKDMKEFRAWLRTKEGRKFIGDK